MNHKYCDIVTDMSHIAGIQLMDSVRRLDGSKGWTTMETNHSDKRKKNIDE